VKQVELVDALAEMADLLEQAAAGEEIVISRDGAPVVKLSPCAQPTTGERRPGALKGKIWMADDFDELPEDIQRAFDGEDP